MSLEMMYTIGNAEFVMPLRDDEIFARLIRKYPRESECVFGVGEPEESSFDAPEAVISREELLDAVASLLAAFKSDPELTPRRYVFDFDIIPGVPVQGRDDVHGVRLPDDEALYNLSGGVENCVLEKWMPSDGPFPVFGEPVDMRNHSVIETESHGPIKIRTQKKRSLISPELKRLQKFLRSGKEDEVVKRLI